MFLRKFLVLVLLTLIHEIISARDLHLEIYMYCNGETIQDKLFLGDYIVERKPYLKNNFQCKSVEDGIKIFLPSSKISAKTNLTSNIILELIKQKDKIIGVNLYRNEGPEDSKYIFQEVRILEQDYLSDVRFETQKEELNIEEANGGSHQSFIRKYWWLIAIGLLIYSILTADAKLMEATDNNNSEQIQQNVARRRITRRA